MSKGVIYEDSTGRPQPCIVFCTTLKLLPLSSNSSCRHIFNGLQQNTQNIFFKITPTPPGSDHRNPFNTLLADHQKVWNWDLGVGTFWLKPYLVISSKTMAGCKPSNVLEKSNEANCTNLTLSWSRSQVMPSISCGSASTAPILCW